MSEKFYDDYKIKPKNPKNSKVLLSLILCAAFLTIFVVGLIVSAGNKNKLLNGMTFYAVSIGKFSSFLRAKDEAEAVKQVGGAGYVHVSEGVDVLLFAYNSESDAASVLKNVLQYETQIVRIKIEKLNPKIKKELLGDIKIRELFFEIQQQITAWYDYAIRLDKGEISSTDIVSYALKLKNKLTTFNIYLSGRQSDKDAAISLFLQQILLEVDDLFNIVTNEWQFRGKVKHLYLSLIIETKNMLNNLS